MKNSDLPAMPVPLTEDMTRLIDNHEALDNYMAIFSGLTKREYFAGLAMQGLFAKHDVDINNAARYAVLMADALLAELERAK